MKKLILPLMLVMGLMMIPMTAMATTFTMNQSQLMSLYQTYENPDHPGTFLISPNQATIDGGVKFEGRVLSGEFETGWAQIQIGANFWGLPWGGSAGDEPTIGDLGMGSLDGYDSYALRITNADENPWKYNLYGNVGYTDLGETNYYIQNTWTEIANGSSSVLVLDFTNAQVWGGGYDGDWVDVTLISGIDPTHISNIGFNIGGDMPVGLNDYTFETEVAPIPEPATMLLLGSGFIGLAFLGRKKLFKKS